MLVKTSELQGAALDWAVAKCEGLQVAVPLTGGFPVCRRHFPEDNTSGEVYAPHFNWSQGGPIIDREEIGTRPPRNTFAPNGKLVSSKADGWFATNYTEFEGAAMPGTSRFGPTALIAAMRCYVASKLGDEVDIPEGL